MDIQVVHHQVDGLGSRILNGQVEYYLCELKRRTVRRGEGEVPAGFGLTTFRTVLLSAFGAMQSILRVDGHIGFDYRTIPRILTSVGSALDKRAFTPVGVLGAFTNSQVHYRFTRPRANN